METLPLFTAFIFSHQKEAKHCQEDWEKKYCVTERGKQTRLPWEKVWQLDCSLNSWTVQQGDFYHRWTWNGRKQTPKQPPLLPCLCLTSLVASIWTYGKIRKDRNHSAIPSWRRDELVCWNLSLLDVFSEQCRNSLELFVVCMYCGCCYVTEKKVLFIKKKKKRRISNSL